MKLDFLSSAKKTAENGGNHCLLINRKSVLDISELLDSELNQSEIESFSSAIASYIGDDVVSDYSCVSFSCNGDMYYTDFNLSRVNVFNIHGKLVYRVFSVKDFRMAVYHHQCDNRPFKYIENGQILNSYKPQEYSLHE